MEKAPAHRINNTAEEVYEVDLAPQTTHQQHKKNNN